MVLENNSLALLYKSHKERLEAQAVRGQPELNIRMFLIQSNLNIGHDRINYIRSRYNDSVVSGEVAAVFETIDGDVPDEIYVAIEARDAQMTRLDIRNPLTEPLCYPLLFLYGEIGKKHSFYAKNHLNRLILIIIVQDTTVNCTIIFKALRAKE